MFEYVVHHPQHSVQAHPRLRVFIEGYEVPAPTELVDSARCSIDSTGTLKVSSRGGERFTFGELLDGTGLSKVLGSYQVALSSNGRPVVDYRALPLAGGQDLVLYLD